VNAPPPLEDAGHTSRWPGTAALLQGLPAGGNDSEHPASRLRVWLPLAVGCSADSGCTGATAEYRRQSAAKDGAVRFAGPGQAAVCRTRAGGGVAGPGGADGVPIPSPGSADAAGYLFCDGATRPAAQRQPRRQAAARRAALVGRMLRGIQ
jgi:hypothetical protein